MAACGRLRWLASDDKPAAQRVKHTRRPAGVAHSRFARVVLQTQLDALRFHFYDSRAPPAVPTVSGSRRLWICGVDVAFARARPHARPASAVRDVMKRTLLLLIVVGGLTTTVAALAGLRWAAQQAPEFYDNVADDAPAPAVRHEAARRFAQQTAELVEEFRYAPVWQQEFTQTQVNAWLAEDLPEQYGSKIPKGVSDPRVQFADGLVRVGFRLRSKQFQGIVSLDLRPSVPEPNKVAIAIESLSAGLLPLSPATFIKDVTKQLDRYQVEHEWQTNNGVHVLVVTVVPTRGDRPVLETIEIQRRKLRVAGHRETPPTLTMRDGGGRRQL